MYFKIVVLLILPFFMAQQDTNEMDTKDNKGVSKNDRMGKCEYLACHEAIFPTMMTNSVQLWKTPVELPLTKTTLASRMPASPTTLPPCPPAALTPSGSAPQM